MADEPACGASNENIGRKVLLTEYPCEADAGGQRVDAQLTPAGGVLTCDDGGGGPGEQRVRGGEGGAYAGATLVEQAAGVILCRPLPPGEELDALLDDDSIEERLSAKDASFAGVRIVMEVTEAVQGYGCSEEAAYKDV